MGRIRIGDKIILMRGLGWPVKSAPWVLIRGRKGPMPLTRQAVIFIYFCVGSFALNGKLLLQKIPGKCDLRSTCIMHNAVRSACSKINNSGMQAPQRLI